MPYDLGTGWIYDHFTTHIPNDIESIKQNMNKGDIFFYDNPDPDGIDHIGLFIGISKRNGIYYIDSFEARGGDVQEVKVLHGWKIADVKFGRWNCQEILEYMRCHRGEYPNPNCNE
jgi:hypothetical protein